MMKRIVLCADDYGQAPAISEGVVNLIQAGRITATSCMVNTPYWAEHANWLLPFLSQVDIGLHFNLTEGEAVSREYTEAYGGKFSGLRSLMWSAYMRRLDPKAIEAELNAQLDRFLDALGFLPRFVDGHQHIHQFPIIRDVLVRVYEQRLRAENAYIRLVNEALKPSDLIFGIKKVIIRALGSGRLRTLLLKHNIPHNQSFAGIYSFANTTDFSRLFPDFAGKIGDYGLIMCHPALSPVAGDPISHARMAEYQYLHGGQFLLDCHEQQVVLDRFG